MHLSSASESIVRRTASVVAAHADEITRVFYPSMFAAHPEFLNVFNQANQAAGEQPRALARSIVAFATHLIDPMAPDFAPVLRRIAHKHVSLGISAAQYLIVQRHLLDAIGAVLGDAVTAEVRSAWDEVYWLFATGLIAEEALLYSRGGTDPATPWRRYRVVERFEESEDVFSLVLAPLEGTAPEHATGQYVSIAVDLPGGRRQARQYTISSGRRGDSLRVTIKRVQGTATTPPGEISTWLHMNAAPGTELDLSQPAGDVVLDDSDQPLVLISAGIGITPIAAILEDVSRRQHARTVRLYHADTTHAAHPLYASLRRQVLSMPDAHAQNWYEQGAESAPTLRPARAGRMDLSDTVLPENARVFMCGPLPFMQAMRTTLLSRGIPAERIHYEIFGPDLWAAENA
ncbi:hemin transporter [Microbacterium resistens]|uniref:nitric oxide dioxygenase n=1 Tax=Microbacterium resistens TaxID=156977 RepID=A0ABY3RYB4_9MICO|nr:globin domain-containing protein [Microbacterium resistens]UGS28375.1 hemin transporter [Microbacterium resistens]